MSSTEGRRTFRVGKDGRLMHPAEEPHPERFRGRGSVYIARAAEGGPRAYRGYWDMAPDGPPRMIEAGPGWEHAADAVAWGRVRTNRVLIRPKEGSGYWWAGRGDPPVPGLEGIWPPDGATPFPDSTYENGRLRATRPHPDPTSMRGKGTVWIAHNEFRAPLVFQGHWDLEPDGPPMLIEDGPGWERAADAVAWGRERTDRVFIRPTETSGYWWAGPGESPTAKVDGVWRPEDPA